MTSAVGDGVGSILNPSRSGLLLPALFTTRRLYQLAFLVELAGGKAAASAYSALGVVGQELDRLRGAEQPKLLTRAQAKDRVLLRRGNPNQLVLVSRCEERV